MREFVPFICLAFVAASGMFFGVTGRPGAGSRATSAAATSSRLKAAGPTADEPAADEPGSKPSHAVRLLCDFHGIPVTEVAGSADPLAALHHELECLPVRSKVHFLIAVVSDPLESSADHFDTLLDAMQRGFEGEQFVIDQPHLLWKDFLDGRGRAKSGEPLYRSQPGVVLFRRTSRATVARAATAPNEVVAVLLVGENPIYGIHQAALAEALRTCAAWLRLEGETSPLRLQILGPTYSGSAVSLQHGLRRWLDSEPGDVLVEILSGSAMAPSNKKYLDAELKGGDQGVQLVNFHSLSLPSYELQEVFFRDYLLHQLGADYDQIVMLTEANTTYGSSSRVNYGKAKSPLYISYPAQIGRTRNAYERQNLLSLPASGERAGKAVEFRLEDNPHAADLPPTFSPATAAHVERMLLTLLDAVNREGRHYVGLMGTSVEDRLFLAQLIYHRCPNVRLFCLDNNLLYTHPKYNRYLEGMLIASPFPLYPRHIEASGTGPSPPITAFSSDEAQATYVACRTVLGRLLGNDNSAALQLEYAAPLFNSGHGAHEQPPEPPPEPERPSRPPVWVVQVGRNRLTPIALLPTGTGTDQSGKPLSDDDAADHYTLRFDKSWRTRRAQALQQRMPALCEEDLLGTEPEPKSEPAKSVEAGTANARSKLKADTMHLHGPHPLYRACVAALGLLLLLAGINEGWKRLSATGAEPSASPARAQLALVSRQCRAVRRVEWCCLIALGLATFVLMAAPVALARGFEFDKTWFDVCTLFAGTVALIGAPVAVVLGIRNCFTVDYRAIVFHRRKRVTARCQSTPPLRRGLVSLGSIWEVWALPVFGILLPLAAAILFLLQLYCFEHVSQRFYFLEQLASPADHISPLVPLWLAMLGFVFLLGTRVLRAVRVLNETPQVKSRLELILPWREGRSLSSAKRVVPELRDAQRAIEAIEQQAAIGGYWFSGILKAGLVVLLVTAFFFIHNRLTTQPFGIEWSLRLAFLGLTVAAVCLIGSGLECLRALESFWRHFSTQEWHQAWKRLPQPLRDSLKWRLFAFLPEGYVPGSRREDSGRLRELKNQVAVRLEDQRPLMTPGEVKALDDLQRWNGGAANDTPVWIGLELLRLLTPLAKGAWAGVGLVARTQQEVRQRLAPYVAELSLFVLSQLCRRLLGALVVVLILMMSLESYPFKPERFLIVMQLVFVAAAVAAAVWTYLAVNVNSTLSTMSDEQTGLTIDFKLLYESLLFLGVPVLTVLSLHFPDFSDYFNSAADAVKGVKF